MAGPVDAHRSTDHLSGGAATHPPIGDLVEPSEVTLGVCTTMIPASWSGPQSVNSPVGTLELDIVFVNVVFVTVFLASNRVPHPR